MASRSPHAPATPHTSPLPERFRYETRYPERMPGAGVEESEPRLGPYETRYSIELGYPAQTRSLG